LRTSSTPSPEALLRRLLCDAQRRADLFPPGARISGPYYNSTQFQLGVPALPVGFRNEIE
jgi:hypothetical protein